MERREEERAELTALHDRLLEHFGPQGWWPGEGPWDVCAGAILTQNTRWANAERALENLAAAGLRTPERVLDVSNARLRNLVRPAGFFRTKSRALQGLAGWVVRAGGFDRLAALSHDVVRDGLLEVRGVGHETADCILLYALNCPVFVADAYARRILERTGIWRDWRRAQYLPLKRWAEGRLPKDVGFLKEMHALLVETGKAHCQPRPRCGSCPLLSGCRYADGDYWASRERPVTPRESGPSRKR